MTKQRPIDDSSSRMIEQSGGSVHWLDTPDGLRLRAAHWAGGLRGTVVVLNGRTEFIEKYLEPIASLQVRGFAVWTLDWRGQGLSSRVHPDRLANHVDSFESYLDDLDLLLDRRVLPTATGTLYLLGHSMGGHLAARALARRPGVFGRAILTAPMIGFRSSLPRGVAQMLISLASLGPGQRGRYAPGTPRRPPLDFPFETNPLTTCPERYAGLIGLLRENPGLQLGGATWGWLRAASASMAVLQRAATLARIRTPTLIAVAGEERFVDNAAIYRFAARLLGAETIVFPEARHELLREQDRHRLRLWAAIDRFLGD